MNLHWDTIIEQVEQNTYHPSIKRLCSIFPATIDTFPNLIFYGPDGSGKYSQMLYVIQKYSNSHLKYEKKIAIQTSKNQENYFIKMSDIHFEIDFNLLGCNSKQLWNDIFLQITDIVSSHIHQKFIIVCKNFQEINIETLEVFYSYLQNSYSSYKFAFILLTNAVSFIPENIINLFITIPVSKTEYIKHSTELTNTNMNTNTNKIMNKINSSKNTMIKLVDDLIYEIMNYKQMKYNTIRTKLYNLLIFNHSLNEFVEKITYTILAMKELTMEQSSSLIIANQRFLFFFQNNYRPIFHLESYFYTILKIIHGL